MLLMPSSHRRIDVAATRCSCGVAAAIVVSVIDANWTTAGVDIVAVGVVAAIVGVVGAGVQVDAEYPVLKELGTRLVLAPGV